MSTILGDLREGDHFNIITFSDKVHTWKKGRTVRATRQNVRDAKDFVKRIIAEGCELKCDVVDVVVKVDHCILFQLPYFLFVLSLQR